MSDSLFQISGPSVPPLVGRKSAMQRLTSSLAKPTPDHLQVVGPRFFGKTILMHSLAEKIRSGDARFKTVVLWDLAHNTPATDDDFIRSLVQQIANQIAPVYKDYADHLRGAGGNGYSELREVIDILDDEKVKILLLWDGFDKAFGSSRLTRNLWDQMRDLASRPGLRIVTSSRKPLHELPRDSESKTSDFWGLFDTSPVRLQCFDDEDLVQATGHLATITFGSGAKAELLNWTAGVPPLIFSLLNKVNEAFKGATVEGADINRLAMESIRDLNPFLGSLWSDCPESSKDLYFELVEAQSIDVKTCKYSDVAPLEEKGFATRSASKVHASCRLLETFVKERADDSGSIGRLFGSEAAFQANARILLDRRLDETEIADADVRLFLSRCLADIPHHLDMCLYNIRGIVDRVLDLIWNAELGPKRQIPVEYTSDWQHYGERAANEDWGGRCPTNRGAQLRLLKLLTTPDRAPIKAKYVTNVTHTLVESAHSFANLGQHLIGRKVDFGTVFAAMCVCLELASRTSRELTAK
jgi:hypothetical protein